MVKVNFPEKRTTRSANRNRKNKTKRNLKKKGGSAPALGSKPITVTERAKLSMAIAELNAKAAMEPKGSFKRTMFETQAKIARGAISHVNSQQSATGTKGVPFITGSLF